MPFLFFRHFLPGLGCTRYVFQQAVRASINSITA